MEASVLNVEVDECCSSVRATAQLQCQFRSRIVVPSLTRIVTVVSDRPNRLHSVPSQWEVIDDDAF